MTLFVACLHLLLIIDRGHDVVGLPFWDGWIHGHMHASILVFLFLTSIGMAFGILSR